MKDILNGTVIVDDAEEAEVFTDFLTVIGLQWNEDFNNPFKYYVSGRPRKMVKVIRWLSIRNLVMTEIGISY